MNTNWNDPNFQGFGGKNPFGGRPKKAKAPRKAVGTPLGRTALNLAVTLLVGAVYYYAELPALNLHSGTLYVFVILLCAVYCGMAVLTSGFQGSGAKGYFGFVKKQCTVPFVLAAALAVTAIVGTAVGWEVFRAGSYRDLLTVDNGDFAAEVERGLWAVDGAVLAVSAVEGVQAQTELYFSALRELPGVKKVFIRSGIRFDYVMLDEKHGREFVRELAEHHVSGQLRVAPEHVSHGVLSCMGKPDHAIYERFVSLFEEENARAGKKQFIVPYLMSSHPGSTMKEAVELAEFVRDMGFNPEQVSDFYPTPGSLATVMYFTGLDPRTMEPVYVPKNPHEKALQRALIQYRDPKNYALVHEALEKAGRTDLIGYGEKCLIRPRKGEPAEQKKPAQPQEKKPPRNLDFRPL